MGKGTNIYWNVSGHMTKLATMSKYGKHLYLNQITDNIKFDVQHQVIMFYQVYPKYDPSLTLTFFTKVNFGS